MTEDRRGFYDAIQGVRDKQYGYDGLAGVFLSEVFLFQMNEVMDIGKKAVL